MKFSSYLTTAWGCGFWVYKTDSIDHNEVQWCIFLLVVLTTVTELAIMIYSKSDVEVW